MPDRLEARLLELGREIDWPQTPELRVQPDTVAHRERRRAVTPRVRRAWALGLAVLLVGAGTAAAVPGIRDAILDLFRDHGVSVRRAPELPPVSRELDLGRRVTLAEARLVSGRDVVVLGDPALGRPAVFVRDGVVSLLYGDGVDRILLTQIPGDFEPYIQKTIQSSAPVERVRVRGRPGLWLPEPHTVLIEDPRGQVREERPRLAASTLLWLRGPLTLRLEGRITKERALALAYSSSSSSS